MAVTKRTRFEVLRRDNYTCRYCRSTDGALTVDHVTPRSLGGSDDPSNLVACCKDCNAGKSSAAPDASLVAEVTDDAIRHAERIKQAYKILVEQLGEQDDYISEFATEFKGRTVPQGWKGSLIRWFEMGVPIEIVIDAGHRADCRTYASTDAESWFKYLAGVVWKKAETVTEEVRRREPFDGCWYSWSDLIDIRWEEYQRGHAAGEEEGSDSVFFTADVGHTILSCHVDGLHSEFGKAHADFATRRRLDDELEATLRNPFQMGVTRDVTRD